MIGIGTATKYAWKGLVILILTSVIVGIGLLVGSYTVEIFNGISSIYNYIMMVSASFDWLIPFTAFRIVFWTMLVVEASFLILKLVFGYLYVSRD